MSTNTVDTSKYYLVDGHFNKFETKHYIQPTHTSSITRDQLLYYIRGQWNGGKVYMSLIASNTYTPVEDTRGHQISAFWTLDSSNDAQCPYPLYYADGPSKTVVNLRKRTAVFITDKYRVRMYKMGPLTAVAGSYITGIACEMTIQYIGDVELFETEFGDLIESASTSDIHTISYVESDFNVDGIEDNNIDDE